MASVDQGISLRFASENYVDKAQGIVGNPAGNIGSYGWVVVSITTGVDSRDISINFKSPGGSSFVSGITPLLYSALFYSMRRTDTGAVGGYAHWVNTTGTASGAPAPIGTVGAPQILAVFSAGS